MAFNPLPTIAVYIKMAFNPLPTIAVFITMTYYAETVKSFLIFGFRPKAVR